MEDEVERSGSKRARWLLRYRDQFMQVRRAMTLGRDWRCDLIFQDSMVSRRHAALGWDERGAYVEDLDSANGVFVNDDRIHGRRGLVPGDRIKVGRQLLLLVSPDAGAGPGVPADCRTEPPAATAGQVGRAGAEDTGSGSWSDSSSWSAQSRVEFVNLGDAAREMIQAGNVRGAEAIVAAHLRNLLAEVTVTHQVPEDTLAWAAELAITLARASHKGEWFDYVVELHLEARHPARIELVDELFIVLRSVAAADARLLRRYADAMTAHPDTKEELLGRLASLSRLAAMK